MVIPKKHTSFKNLIEASVFKVEVLLTQLYAPFWDHTSGRENCYSSQIIKFYQFKCITYLFSFMCALGSLTIEVLYKNMNLSFMFKIIALLINKFF